MICLHVIYADIFSICISNSDSSIDLGIKSDALKRDSEKGIYMQGP